MNSISIRRPLGCLKTTLRHSRQQQQQRRGYANAILKAPQVIEPAPPTGPPRVYGILHPKRRREGPQGYKTGFAVYATPKTHMNAAVNITHPHLLRPHATPLAAHHAYQIRKMDPSGARTKLFDRASADAAKVGDVLLVQAKRTSEPFAGVLMCIRRRGIETAILLRGQLSRVGVEMWFKVYSRNVTGIDIIKRAEKRARRAKLTYLRHPKHDVGNVEHLVRKWRSNKMANASKSRLAGGKKRKIRNNSF